MAMKQRRRSIATHSSHGRMRGIDVRMDALADILRMGRGKNDWLVILTVPKLGPYISDAIDRSPRRIEWRMADGYRG